MNRAAVVAAILFVFSLFPGTVEAAGGPSDEQLNPADLLQLWQDRRHHQENGDWDGAIKVEEQLRRLVRLGGGARQDELAGALVLEGLEHLQVRRMVQARSALQLAIEMDPEMPHAHFALARVLWGDGGDLGETLSAAWSGMNAWIWHRIFRIQSVRAGGWPILTGIPLAAAALFLMLLLRNLRLVHHRLCEAYGRVLPPATSSTLAAVTPWLPLALPWGPGWTPLIWLVLAAPTLRRSERVVASCALTVAALCGVLLLPFADATARAAEGHLLHVAEAARGAVGAERLQTIEDLVEAEPNDAVLWLLHADQARGMGDYATALQSYKLAHENDPSLHQALNNRGTLLFHLEQYASAMREFRSAIEVAPEEMLHHYNLYLTQQHRFDFTNAEKTLREAQSIDLEGMTALLSDRNDAKSRLDVLQARIPVSLALQHARAAAGVEVADTLESLISGWPILAAMLFGLVSMWRGGWRNGLPVECPSCGRTSCRQCALNAKPDEPCASCVALHGRATALPREVRRRKKAEILSYRRRWDLTCRLLSFLVPGAGQIWSGRVLLGTVLLVPASCAAIAVLLHGITPDIIYQPLAVSAVVTHAPALLALLLTWLAGWLLPVAPATGAWVAPRTQARR